MSDEYGASAEKPSNILANSQKKPQTIWTQQEDEMLTSAVRKCGNNWVDVEKEMHKQGIQEKTGKQCRERWIHQLDPSINRSDFSEVEMSIIFSMHKEMGNRWIEISRRLPGRTDNMIKNFYYATVRKEVKRIDSELKAMPEFNELNVSKSSYFQLQKIMKLNVHQLSKVPVDQIGAALMKIRETKRKRSMPEEISRHLPQERISESVEEREFNPPYQNQSHVPYFQSPSPDQPSVPQISQSLSAIQSISSIQPSNVIPDFEGYDQRLMNVSYYPPRIYQSGATPFIPVSRFPFFVPLNNAHIPYQGLYYSWASAYGSSCQSFFQN